MQLVWKRVERNNLVTFANDRRLGQTEIHYARGNGRLTGK